MLVAMTLKISVAFIASVVIFAAGLYLCWWVGKRRPPGTPYTWGEAMVAATFVFAVMLMGYGVVPNEWLRWADDQLLWRSDRIFLAVSSKGIAHQNAAEFTGSGRILISYQSVRDIIAAGIYVVMLGLQIFLWMAWQRRGRTPAPTELETTSRYGRPLVRT